MRLVLPSVGRSSRHLIPTLLALVVLGDLTAPPAARAKLVTLAATGQAAPGGGAFGAHFGVPVIDAAGEVAFTVFTNQPGDTDTGVYQGTSANDLTALLRIGGATTSVGHAVAENAHGAVAFSANGGTQIVARDAGGLHVVANAGDTVRPVGNGPIYTLSGFGDPVINDHGQVAYYAAPPSMVFAGGAVLAFVGEGDTANGQIQMIGSAVSLDDLGDTAFFEAITLDGFANPNLGALASANIAVPGVGVVVKSLDGVAGGDQIAIANPGTSVPMISPAGIVFRTASFVNFTDNSGVFLIQGSTITTIAKGGDPAPGGGTFSHAVNNSSYLPFDEPQINDNGSIVFVGWTDGGPGHGVYRFTQAHGLEAMALEGHAPYAAAAGFRNAVINNNDVVAFQAFDGSAGNGRGVYITDGVNSVRAGSDSFFGAEGSSTGAFSQAFFGSEDEGLSPLNDHAQVTFVSSVGSTSQSVIKFSVDPSWVQPAGGNWDTAANWIFSGTPTTDSDVSILGQAAGPLVVTGPVDPTTVEVLALGTGPNTAELDLQSGGPLTASAELIVHQHGVLGGAGAVTTADLEVETGGKIVGPPILNAPVYNNGLIDGDFTFDDDVTNEVAGTIKGNETFNGALTNDGTLSPGHSPGIMTVSGDLTLQAQNDAGTLTGSALEIEIGGPNPGDYDVIDVSGHLALAGALHVTFINGFTPAPGETFHILNAGSVSGTFDVVTGAVVTSTQGGIDIAPPATVNATPKALVKCAGALAKAGGVFSATRLKTLDACVGTVFKCVQETTPAKRDACIAKAGAGCGKDVAKLASLATKLTAALDQGCGGIAADDLSNAGGLGFQAVADACANTFGTTLDALPSIEQCVLRAHACLGESVLAAQAPRAKELMRIAGVATAALDALACLPDDLGAGADLGAPKGAGKAVTTCEATLIKAGNGFLAKTTKGLDHCVAAVFACDLEKPGDAGCTAKARATCDKAFTARDAATTALTTAIAKKCTPPGLDPMDLTAPAGANVAALASDCAALGVASVTTSADYATCLARRETCAGESLVRFETPRADVLLGEVARSLDSAFCP